MSRCKYGCYADPYDSSDGWVMADCPIHSECSCEYPHYHDFDMFEFTRCTCHPECEHNREAEDDEPEYPN